MANKTKTKNLQRTIQSDTFKFTFLHVVACIHYFGSLSNGLFFLLLNYHIYDLG